VPPINLTATENGGFFLEEEADYIGPVLGTEFISYRDKAQGPSLDNKIRLGDHATIAVIPPQPYLISGPTQVNSTQVIRSFAGPFTQASNLLRSAILAVVSDTTDDVATPMSHLSAFVTTDGGLTWSEVVGPYIFQWDYTMWQATYGSGWTPSDTQVHLAGFCQPPWPAGNNFGTLPPGYDLALGFGGIPICAGREGSSDDIFTINTPRGITIVPEQMPFGLQQTGGSWPFNMGSPSFFDYGYVSQSNAASMELWLYSFNLASFSWSVRGKCGEYLMIGPGGSYAHGGGSFGGLLCAPDIIAIKNGRGIAMTHFGGQWFNGVGNGSHIGFPPVPGSIFPVNAGPGGGAEMIMNFSTTGGSHNWSYVTDPDSNSTANPSNPPNNSWRPGLRSDFQTRGILSNGDIVLGGNQVDIAVQYSRYRVMRWPSGSSSEIPIFENAVGPIFTGGSFILYPPDGTPPVTPFNGSNLIDFQGNLDSYRQDMTAGKVLAIQPLTAEGDYFGILYSDNKVIVNNASQAWVAALGILGNQPQTPNYTTRLRVRLSWIPFSMPFLRPEPLLYSDAIPPPSGHEASGSKVFHQPLPPFYNAQPIGHTLGPDKTLGICTVQPVLNPYTGDFCTANPPGGPQYEGGIYNIYYSRAWIPWPAGVSGAYISGKGNFLLG